MDFFEVVAKRQSVRSYAEYAVEKEKLDGILAAANEAPSAGNLQAYEIFVARKREHLAALAAAALSQDFIARAPAALVFCAHPARAAGRYGERGMRLYALQDATIACTYAMLAATALGLATVWIGAFNDDAVRRVLRVPEDILPAAILAIGYAAEKPLRTPRRLIDDLVHELA
ncbi:MAG: nitroreductase family protein [Acidobacteriota bacterium]